ncbi:hypothetical protein [Alkalimarinus sediminis]|uniref:DUF481 domain-containing protein n=1 Tax=Alkalimarinus sediminis TaxID=1632866 RepID=A0A9E8HUH5_9ALTE|nr:hypothetical protein [Alkalimarinus sediminis]UZW75959.1 hypothetical protein NNL22_05090 [Alkalimarinus sediminis]
MVNRFIVIAMLLSVSAWSHSSSILEFEGRAYDAKTDKFIYLEKHRVTLDSEGNYASSDVQYVDEKGDVFAAKQVNYEFSRTAPSFSFHDYRNDTRVEVKNQQQRIKLISKNGAAEITKSLPVSEEKGLVVDAGFDRFIYENWDRLLNQRDVSFAFLAISRAMFVNLDVSETRRTEESVVYTVKPSNFFLSLLVEPIELTYSINSQRLVQFEGLTNIAKSEGGRVTDDNYVAVIRYQYF